MPSPIRPVRAISTIVRTTSSTRRSSTQSVISTLGRKASEYSLPRVFVEIALLPAVALHLADAASLQRRMLQGAEHLLDQVRLDDGNNLFHAEFPKAIPVRLTDSFRRPCRWRRLRNRKEKGDIGRHISLSHRRPGANPPLGGPLGRGGENAHNDGNSPDPSFQPDAGPMAKRSSYQQRVIRNYYENQGTFSCNGWATW